MKKLLIAAVLLFITSCALPVATVHATPKKAKQQIQQAKVHTQYLKKLNSVSLWFDGLHNVESIEYTLSYKSNGVTQGVSGTIEDKSFHNHADISRKIQLATCSTNTCANHKNITDLKLEVSFTYENGKVVTKTYDLGRRFDRDHDKRCDWD